MKYKHHVPRLKDFDYFGPYAYFITCLTYKRESYFLDYKKYAAVFSILKEVAKSNARILVYCFMPDHLHLLIEGDGDFCLPDFMKLFKQKSSFGFKREYAQILWQRGYYDHVVRREESYKEVAKYILNNPVRRGLTKSFDEYELSGSLVFNKNTLL